MILPVTAVCTALLMLVALGLSARISQLRFTRRIALGDGGDRDLLAAGRAFGNLVEHAPLWLLALLLLEQRLGGHAVVWLAAALFIGGRVLMTSGLLSRPFTRRRQIGALATYLGEAVVAIALLVIYLPALVS